jgi:hypothetical protein
LRFLGERRDLRQRPLFTYTRASERERERASEREREKERKREVLAAARESHLYCTPFEKGVLKTACPTPDSLTI